ncbi:MAG: formate dehydrogenase family accessory protein FdhD [Cyanobacteria bacterium PR.3.49]|nr:formate dehydrogenase family accessory protein FdhD [Cyanobacteria bacterium PR.3.49]
MTTTLNSDDANAVSGKGNVVEVLALKFDAGAAQQSRDAIAVEEPLEIFVAGHFEGKDFNQTIAVTMRTPGNDEELALGFLFGEGVIGGIADVDNAWVKDCNFVGVSLRSGVPIEKELLERHSFVNSSCGVCGKKSIESVLSRLSSLAQTRTNADDITISGALICKLPDKLRNRQDAFDSTGGSHAAALFDCDGQLIAVQEDVGRHNALDKLIGSRLKLSKLPLCNCILMLSGRASFELIQKAACAGIPIVASVGAPSSLAVELANDCGITLMGFVRDKRFNIYSAAHRIRLGENQ